jgi:hypothetical protein
VWPGDRVVKSIMLIDNGQAAKVEMELPLRGKAQPRGYEIWESDSSSRGGMKVLMNASTPRYWEIFFEVYENLPRQAPGNP